MDHPSILNGTKPVETNLNLEHPIWTMDLLSTLNGTKLEEKKSLAKAKKVNKQPKKKQSKTKAKKQRGGEKLNLRAPNMDDGPPFHPQWGGDDPYVMGDNMTNEKDQKGKMLKKKIKWEEMLSKKKIKWEEMLSKRKSTMGGHCPRGRSNGRKCCPRGKF